MSSFNGQTQIFSFFFMASLLMILSLYFQVSHEKLVDVVSELFVNAEILEARRLAARQAYLTLSRGIVEKLWDTLHFHIFMKSVSTDDAHGERG